jgi:hypothetical protein
MHIHGSHLNLLPPSESGAATAAARRTADVRKKLMDGVADETSFEQAMSPEKRVDPKGEGEARQPRRQSKSRTNFRPASASEDESADEQRTSVWA